MDHLARLNDIIMLLVEFLIILKSVFYLSNITRWRVEQNNSDLHHLGQKHSFSVLILENPVSWVGDGTLYYIYSDLEHPSSDFGCTSAWCEDWHYSHTPYKAAGQLFP